MQAHFTVGPAFRPGSDPGFDSEVLSALLECWVTINRAWRKRNPRARRLYDSGVRYGRVRMPDGSLGAWESAPDAYLRGQADCKVLTPIRIAELREEGVPSQPAFRTLILTDAFGRQRKSTHILVEREAPGGIFQRRKLVFECPSTKLGMIGYFASQQLQAAVV